MLLLFPLLRKFIKDERGFLEPWLWSFWGITLIVTFAMIFVLVFGIFTRVYTVRGWLENTTTYAATMAISVDEHGDFSNVDINLGRAVFKRAWLRKTRDMPIQAEIVSVIPRGDTLPQGIIAEESGFITRANFIWTVQVPFIGEQTVGIPITAFGVRQARQ